MYLYNTLRKKRLELAAIFLLFFGSSSCTDMDTPDAPIYTAVSSKVFYPFSTYNISVFVEPNPASSSPIRVSATISSEKERISSEEIQLLPGQARVIPIEVGNVNEREYNLTITVFDPREKKYESQAKIFASRRDKSILIQTDKPIYKPGETVRFRVLLLDRELKPLTDDQTVDLKILDGQRNLIKKIEALSIQDGFYKNELELSKEPILGDWSIEVQLKGRTAEEEDVEEIQQVVQADANSVVSKKRVIRPPFPRPPVAEEDVTLKSVTFSVDQYVLPKYKVTIKPPPFITFKDFKFPVTVEAKYTYGKGVKGECTLILKKAYFYRYNEEKEEVVSHTFPLDGSHTIDVDIASLFKKKDENFYEQDVKLEASVTEDVTGKQLKGETSVRIHKNEYKMTQVKQTESIKPGLPYSTIIKVTTQNDIPVQDAAPTALKVKHGFSFDKESGSFSTSIPPSGLVSMTFPTPTNELIQAQRIELKYKDLKTSFHMPGLYQSSSGMYMQVKRIRREEEPVEDEGLTDPIATVKSPMTININATRPFQTFSYIIHGRQDVLAAATVNLPQPTTDYNLEILCPEKAEPEARIIVYTILTDTKEVVADFMKFQAKKLEQDNYLNITLSEETREPGQNVTLKLDSLKGSRVALRAVDQSVLLLKEDKDITQENLDEEVKNRENEATWLNRNWGGSDAYKIFEEGGLVIVTNANIQAAEQPEYGHFGGGAHKVAAFALSADSAMVTRAGSHEVRVRSNFPETWLWEEVTLNESNTFDLQRTVPDTLTSWIISGYSLNSAGVGILQKPRQLTTFRPFFISLNLPYSVVKGEVLLLQVLVHNYGPEGALTAEVELDNSEGKFEFADEKSKSAAKQTKTVSLSANGVSSVKFAIIPKQFGFIALNVKGYTATAGDALSQPLRVVPPGQRQQRSTAALLKPASPTEDAEARLEAVFPESRVEGADSLKLTLISDILGPTIKNMDKLLELPTGCGEQNMMTFVADIVILNYLQAAGSLESEVKAKAIKYLETGYQRQLTYRRFDGSFSAFGQYDSSGSTWLTAFVVRSFIQAKPYITIDDDVIKSALEFLAKQQSPAGGFFEPGRVFQKSLQGGSHSNGIALTAYTLLAFLEARDNWDAPPETAGPPGEEKPVDRKKINGDIVDLAIKFVTEKTKSGDFDDVYALVISTYAAHLANHGSKGELFGKLEGAGKKDQGLTYYEVEKKNVTDNCTEKKICLWEFMSQPVSVEMTSYALLTYLLRGEAPAAFPLVRWLLNKRNSHGGFVSTQDTVVGLTALSKYAELTKGAETKLKVNYDAGSGGKEVLINARNADVLQEYELPIETRAVEAHASGKGTVLAQLSWTYYVEDAVREPAFAIRVDTTQTAAKDLNLKVCTSYLKEGTSNMAIVEVNLPSGYSFDAEPLAALRDSVSNYKRHEVENQNTKLQIYFDSLSSEETCIPLVANRVFTVGKQAPAYVSVYDYYDTTETARAFYEPPQLSICDICNETNDCDANNCV